MELILRRSGTALSTVCLGADSLMTNGAGGGGTAADSPSVITQKVLVLREIRVLRLHQMLLVG